MKCELEAQQFKKWLELINSVSQECKLHVTNNGISNRTVDPSNVCMITTEIENTSFNSYSFDNDSEIVYGLNVGKFLAKAKEAVKFGRTIAFAIDEVSTSIACGQFNYTAKTLPETDVYRQEPRIPELKLNSEFVVSTKNFINAINSFDKKRHARVIMDDDGVQISQIDDNDDVTTISFNDEITIRKFEPSNTLYSNDYLIKVINKTKGLCSKLDFEFSKDFPCMISNDDGEICFSLLLAPRIEGD